MGRAEPGGEQVTRFCYVTLFVTYGVNCLAMGLFGLMPALFCFLFAWKMGR